MPPVSSESIRLDEPQSSSLIPHLAGSKEDYSRIGNFLHRVSALQHFNRGLQPRGCVTMVFRLRDEHFLPTLRVWYLMRGDCKWDRRTGMGEVGKAMETRRRRLHAAAPGFTVHR